MHCSLKTPTYLHCFPYESIFLFERSEDSHAHKKVPCVFEALEKAAPWPRTTPRRGRRRAAAEAGTRGDNETGGTVEFNVGLGKWREEAQKRETVKNSDSHGFHSRKTWNEAISA